jgi:two-component system chemotaxis sensor kinase CheA
LSTAEPEANHEFLTEFLEDYFAECDEHLTIARRNLLALDQFVGQPTIDHLALDELLRCFHSLKGISGMVGVREAEHLAHQIESYLRALRDGQSTLSPEGMDTLISAVKAFEQVVAGRRQGTPAADLTPVLSRLSAIAETSAPGSASPGPMTPSRVQELKAAENLRLAASAGKKIWRFEFTPVPELADRGINVNVVRGRLNEVGELIQAAPRVMPSGGIAFEFLVASNADESAFASWGEDGLTFTRYELQPENRTTPRDDDQQTRPAPRAPSPHSNVVRVELGRLDDLMRLVGELVISRSRLDDNLRRVEAGLPASGWRPLQETNLAMERQLRDLREGIMRVRMVPIGEIFERMQFVVRDLAREYQKKVKLELRGQQTEIDKLVVERMMDPILHLVRNAVSHGLDAPDERVAAGKDPEGRISLRAYAQAEMVAIEVGDDGRGIDAEQVARRARAAGLISSEAAVDGTMLLDLICAPGFSTREEADRASGRGVGMNVVKNTILGLGGSFEMDTEPGRGTLFTIHLPLTLAIEDALIVSSGDQRYAVPQSSVREVIEVESSTVKVLENNEIISYRGGVLPLLRLSRMFGTNGTAGDRFHAFVVGSGLSSIGIAVDRILGQREVVVRPINDPLIQVAGIAGATELGDGRIVLILEAGALARAARGTAASRFSDETSKLTGSIAVPPTTESQ